MPVRWRGARAAAARWCVVDLGGFRVGWPIGGSIFCCTVPNGPFWRDFGRACQIPEKFDISDFSTQFHRIFFP